jgi:tetratricopeptide (TPR) repeat protein
MKDVGRELGVDYTVEGSVRKSGGRIRIAAQLVEVTSGNHVWAERYDRDLADIFLVQDEVAQTIAATLVGRVIATGSVKARRKPIKDWAAYDCFLQGRQRIQQYDVEAAEPLLRRAVELDRDFAQAHVWLAITSLCRFFLTGCTDHLSKAESYALTALSLDDGDAWSHWAMGGVRTFMGQLDEAGAYFDKAAALNPTDVQIACWRAMWLSRMGRTQDALKLIDKSARRDPFMPDWFWEARSIPMMQERRYAEVVETINRMSRKQVWNHGMLAAAYAQLGRLDDAKDHAAEALRLKPDYSEEWIRVQEPYKDPASLVPLIEGLRKAGLLQ